MYSCLVCEVSNKCRKIKQLYNNTKTKIVNTYNSYISEFKIPNINIPI